MAKNKRDWSNFTLEFRDFHFFSKNEYPVDMHFCLLVLKDGSLSCGMWWPTNNEGTEGGFIRGTADSLKPEEVEAWLNLDRWNNADPLESPEVNWINVGPESDYSVKVSGFRSFEDNELPNDEQYCLLQLYDGHMSGGRWIGGSIYLEDPGYFEHGPAASNIDCDEVWAWAPLEPGEDIEQKPETPAEVAAKEKAAREAAEKKQREKEAKWYKPEKKFNYGMDIEVYMKKAVEKLKHDYPWVTEKDLDPRYRFAIEKEGKRNEYIEYYIHDDGSKSRTVFEGYWNEDDSDGDSFVQHIASCNEYHVVNSNKVVEEYKVPYGSVELMGGWNLEHYIFQKRQSGDFTVDVQAGDRNTGSSRTFGLPKELFEQPSFDAFLDLYSELVPGGPFGLYKEDLIDDEKLMKFLGFKTKK